MSVQVYVHNLDCNIYDALPVAEEKSGNSCWRTIGTKECQVTFFPAPSTPPPPPAEHESDVDF